MNKIERFFAKLTFSSPIFGQKKVRIIRQVQRLIHAKVPINTTLSMLWDLYSKHGRKPKEPMALMIREWQQRLSSGKSLASAMEGWVSVPEQMIIEAGEQSDKLATALDDALQAANAGRGIRNAIVGGIIYPVILLGVLVGMLWGFSTKIVPTFATILPPEQWTGTPATTYMISQFIIEWLPMIGMIFMGAFTAALLSLPILTGPLRLVLDRLPPWSIYKITQGASFMIAMRGFISAGITVQDALRNMLKIGNPYFKERVSAMLSKMNMGRNLGQAMLESGYNFPGDEISGEISIYAELNDFSEALDLLAKEWINDSTQKAQAAAKVINYVMLFAMTAAVGSIAMTMFELQDQIANAVK
jgi:type II secretory pathway component PulF